MRLAYLSADRIELQFASTALSRAMVEPATADVVEALKKCIRFLLKSQRCVQSFERQEIVRKQITCNSDSNFAGCLLESTSTTKAVVCLSSAEAEFYASAKAAAELVASQ